MEAEEGGMQRLPEECVSHVLSLTSPRDACRSASVSWTFRSAAESDAVWERFLPPDYGDIVSRAVEPVGFSSKKELYFRLCGPILIDGRRKSFTLERSSGKKCFMLCARELGIVWGDTPRYWKWDNDSMSRFSEVAVLLDVCWLEISGKIQCRMLSQHTDYVAYLVFKLEENSRGLDFDGEAFLKVGAHTSGGPVCLQPQQARGQRWPMQRRRPHRRLGFPHLLARAPPPGLDQEPLQEVPHVRDNEWMEIKIGEFHNDIGDNDEVDMCFREIRGGHWKQGLVVEGIEVRPRR